MGTSNCHILLGARGEYVRLHDLFGRGDDDVMRTLGRIQRTA